MATKIGRAVAISGGACKSQPWIVTDLQTIDGTEYIQLQMRDYGLVRFVFGERAATTKSEFLNQFRVWRTTATVAALQHAEQPAEQLFELGVEHGWREKKRQRQNLKDAESRGDVPATVLVNLPKVEHNGTTFDEQQVRVKASLDVSASVWVELKTEVLDHVRASMLTSVVQKADSSKFVTWRSSEACYVAKKKEGDKFVYKRFRPSDADVESNAAAKVAAEAWVQAGVELEQ